MSLPPPIPRSTPPELPKAKQNPAQSPPEKFTIAGVLVLLVTILTTIAAAIVFVFNIFPEILPKGRYPILVLVIPIVGSGVAVGGTLAGLCKLLGIALTVPVENDKPSVRNND